MKKRLPLLVITAFISILFSTILTLAINFEFNFANLFSCLNFKGEKIENLVPLSDIEFTDEGYFSKDTKTKINFKGIGDRYISTVKILLNNAVSEAPIELDMYYLDGTSPYYKTLNAAYNGSLIEFNVKINSRVKDLRIDLTNHSTSSFNLKQIVIDNTITPLSLTRTLATRFFIIFSFIMFILLHLILDIRKIYAFIYKYRWQIGIAIIIICVLLELSGSSISMWASYFENNENGLVLGHKRAIRTDEWATSTPMAIAQYYNDYNYFGDILRGSQTDNFIVYGQPTWHIGEIFRPFHWGYLLFGSSKGLAFFWSARFILLLLISFEFMMWITKKNKVYSTLGAFMIGFSPIVQWWFAINGLVEMLIAFQLSILCLLKYINVSDWKKRVGYFSIILICAGMYILTFYPAWMITIGYVILGFIIYVIFDKRKEIRFSKIDIISIILLSLIFASILASVFINSKDTINAVLNTSYPGARFETGGGFISKSFNYLISLFLPFSSKNLPISANPVEISSFISLFPLGFILGLIQIIKNKKKDAMLIMLTILNLFFMAYMFVGFKGILAKVTLMYHVPTGRVLAGFGIANILTLLRCLSLYALKVKFLKAFIASLLFSFTIPVITRRTLPSYVNQGVFIALIAICFIFCILIFFTKSKPIYFSISMCIVLFLTGGSINPIQQSTDVIEKSDFSLNIKKINEYDPGIWIYEQVGYPLTNYLIMSGLPTINSTNTYPNLKLWHKLDKDRKYENIYNRYAHINLVMDKENLYKDKFVLNQADYFSVYLNVKDLKTLNVKYIISNKNLNLYSNEFIKINKIASLNKNDIYKVQY